MNQNEFKKNVLELNGMLNRIIVLEKDDLILLKEKTNGYNDYYIYQNKDGLINIIEHSDNLEYIMKEFDELQNNIVFNNLDM